MPGSAGFYGDIPINNGVGYIFDITYANRRTMEDNAKTDGVYIGRYVLIDYDSTPERVRSNPYYLKKDEYVREGDRDSGVYLYTSPAYEEDKRVLFADRETLDYGYVNGGDWAWIYDIREYKLIQPSEYKNMALTNYYFYKSEGNYYLYTGPIPASYDGKEIYQGIGERYLYQARTTVGPNGTAVFDLDFTSNYTKNYNYDMQRYQDEKYAGRGYDSTVWQKVQGEYGEKYVNIADLNSVVPTFDVAYDAPSLQPVTPHFDANSTNVYYKLHMQPQWGLKIKEAEASNTTSTDTTKYMSDEIVSYEGDPNHFANGAEGKSYPDYAGAIYYNKAGFDPAVRSDTTDMEAIEGEAIPPTTDVISVLPTGKSGQKYNVHGSFVQEARPDTQELKIILPSLGNTISQIWDVVYGTKEMTDGSPNRNMSIDWGNEDGLRLVHENLEEGGFTYSNEQLSSLAGCINTTHDLMGAIISNELQDIVPGSKEDQEALQNALPNRIYYRNNRYYIKGVGYHYTNVTQPLTGEPVYQKVQLTDFTKDTHYLKDEPDYRLATDFDGRIRYWDLSEEEITLDLNDWTTVTCYKLVDGDYILDTEPTPTDGVQYYSITETALTNPTDGVEASVRPQTYFGRPTSGSYEDETGATVTWAWYYTTSKDYVAGSPVAPRNTTFNKLMSEKVDYSKYRYFRIDTKPGDGWSYDDEDGVLSQEGLLDLANSVELNLIQFDPSKKYYYKDENGNFIRYTATDTDDIDYTKVYYTLETEARGVFYVPNRYYYKTPVDTTLFYGDEPIRLDNVTYYRVNAQQDPWDRQYYDAGFYYYKPDPVNNPTMYLVDYSEVMREKTEYFIKKDMYIKEDKTRILPQYSVWNPSVTNVPDHITLAFRENKPIWIELTGFARTLNTINGLIVELNRLAEFDNDETRDNHTVNGLINQMRDIILKFDVLVPERFVTVDNYGRITSSPLTTKQAFRATDYYGNTYTESEKEDRWLSVDIDGTPSETLISVTHTHNEVTGKTDLTYNFNDKNVDTYKLSSPIVDNMGHVVGKNEETLTLPYGYKKIDTNGRSTSETENATTTPSTETVVANNTQDTLNIDSGNKWIRIDTTDADNTLIISHDVHNTTSSTSNASLSNEVSENVTFDIPSYAFDKAGHYVSHNTHTLTMPFGYGKIIGDNVDGEGKKIESAASATYDTLEFGSDEWLTATVSKDKVVYSHDYPNKAADSENEIDMNEGDSNDITLNTVSYDSKGHVTKKHVDIVTLPFGYQTFKDSNTTPGTSNAKNVKDTFVFAGDSWVLPTVTDSLLTISHKDPVTGSDANRANETPAFGATFTLHDDFFDTKGHKYKTTSHTVTIPQGSLTNSVAATESNVITSLGFTPNTGEITVSRTNIGEVKLAGYSALTEPASTTLAAGDKLNEALGKLEFKLNKEISDRETALQSTDKKVEALEKVAMPSYDGLTENGVYTIRKSASGVEWIELSSWTGGSY